MSGSRGRKCVPHDEKGQVGPFLTLPLSIDCGQMVPCLGSTRGPFVPGIPPEGLSGVVQQLGLSGISRIWRSEKLWIRGEERSRRCAGRRVAW